MCPPPRPAGARSGRPPHPSSPSRRSVRSCHPGWRALVPCGAAMRRTSVTTPLAIAAGTATAALVAGEIFRIRRRDHATLNIAARETVDVVRAGYRAGSANETALLNLFVSFTGTFAVARAVTHLIRTDRGPFVNV